MAEASDRDARRDRRLQHSSRTPEADRSKSSHEGMRRKATCLLRECSWADTHSETSLPVPMSRSPANHVHGVLRALPGLSPTVTAAIQCGMAYAKAMPGARGELQNHTTPASSTSSRLLADRDQPGIARSEAGARPAGACGRPRPPDRIVFEYIDDESQIAASRSARAHSH